MLTIVLWFVYWVVVALLVRGYIKSYVTYLVEKDRKESNKRLVNTLAALTEAQAQATTIYVNKKIDESKKSMKQSNRDAFVEGLEAVSEALDRVRMDYSRILAATTEGFTDINRRCNDLKDFVGAEYKTTPAKAATTKLVKKTAKK